MTDTYTFDEIIVNDDTTVLCISDKGKVIGSVTYYTKQNELYNLFVDKNNRGFGYATLLLKEAMRRFNPKYITSSRTYGSDIKRLIKLYESVGFTEMDVRMVVRTD